MEMDFCGPSVPTQFGQSVLSEHSSDLNRSDHDSEQSEQPEGVCLVKVKKHLDKRKHKVWAKYISQSSSSEESQSSVQIKNSVKPKWAPSEQEQQQTDPDPVFYREVDMSDLPSQYAEEVKTFRHVLNLPDPRETMPRSSTTVLALDDEKNKQELRPRGPSSMLPLSPYLKDAFEKFKQDFQVSNLPEGKYIKPPASTAKWYKVGLRCFEDKMQELNSDFAKILWARFPYKFLNNLNTKLGRISAPSTLRLPLLRLLLSVTPPWRSSKTVSSPLLRMLKAKFKRVPILKKQPGVAMRMPVTSLRF